MTGLNDPTEREMREIQETFDKLCHELEMNPELRYVPIHDLADKMNFDCYICGLVKWVEACAWAYRFGPELCIAQRLQQIHDCPEVLMRHISRMERKNERMKLALAERDLRRLADARRADELAAEARGLRNRKNLLTGVMDVVIERHPQLLNDPDDARQYVEMMKADTSVEDFLRQAEITACAANAAADQVVAKVTAGDAP